MKKLFLIFIFILCLPWLVSCNGYDEEALRYDFQAFLKELDDPAKVAGIPEDQRPHFLLPSGYTCEYIKAYTEKDGKNTAIQFNAKDSKWDLLAYADMKEDLNFLCGLFDQYAESIGWIKNDYYLYAVMGSNIRTGIQYTYRQQANHLYVPAAHEDFVAICKAFGTTDLELIASIPEGKQLLENYKIASFKNDKLDIDMYSIYINTFSGDGLKLETRLFDENKIITK